MGLTGFVIIHVFIASFSPAQGERNQIVNAKLTRPVNAMPMSTFKFFQRRRRKGKEGIKRKGKGAVNAGTAAARDRRLEGDVERRH